VEARREVRARGRQGAASASAAVRTPAVVMVGEVPDGALEVPASEDGRVVRALLAHGAHETLSDGVRLRRSHRCPDDRRSLGAEELVKDAGDLRIAVVDQIVDILGVLYPFRAESRRRVASQRNA
jgi:hypothetical protein